MNERQPAAPPRKLVIFDLDETLFHASEERLDHPADALIGPYYAYFRPGLGPFLISISDDFDIAIWSSSTQDYVDAAVSILVPDSVQTRFAWSRTRCVQRYDPEWQLPYFVKDLKKVKKLGYDLSQVLICDDTPQKLERNYGNAIYVKPYYGETEDDELSKLRRYLTTLRDAADVRKIEKRGWRMK
ncbi:MAG: HAD family hydrolase [Planctomycetota bacterium]